MDDEYDEEYRELGMPRPVSIDIHSIHEAFDVLGLGLVRQFTVTMPDGLRLVVRRSGIEAPDGSEVPDWLEDLGRDCEP